MLIKILVDNESFNVKITYKSSSSEEYFSEYFYLEIFQEETYFKKVRHFPFFWKTKMVEKPKIICTDYIRCDSSDGRKRFSMEQIEKSIIEKIIKKRHLIDYKGED